MNQDKRNRKINSEDAKMISLDLQQKTEIDQKVNYYKSILKAYDDLSNSIDKKIERLNQSLGEDVNAQGADGLYERSKLMIEKLEANNSLYEKKKFFEMWLQRSSDYDKKFALLNKECEEKFDEVEAEAKAIALTNIDLQSKMNKYDLEPNKDVKMKTEYYLLLKYEVGKITGKGKFATAN